MPGIAVGLILAVVLYEFLVVKKTAAPVRTTAAAAAGRTTATGAAAVTNSLSTIEKALGQLLQGSAGGAKPSGGSSPFGASSGGTGSQAARPSQTGFNQPSGQDFNPANIGQSVGNLSVYGRDAQGRDVYIDDAGNVFDANGNTLNDLSSIDTSGANETASVFSQSAPGDGGWDQLDQQMGLDSSGGGEAGSGQDAALAQDAADAMGFTDNAQPDTWFDDSTAGF